MVISPHAKLDDGLLDIIIVKKFPLAELPYTLQLAFTHRIDKSPYVETFTGKEVRISRDRGRYVNLDGEAVRTDSLVRVRIQPAALKVIVPGKTALKMANAGGDPPV